jgi:Ca-activated chloride channel family protein
MISIQRIFDIAIAACVLLPAALTGQESAPLRVDVRLVNVFANVTDANGAIIGNLSKDDFSLFEDGHPQKIAVFEKESAMPLSIVLAIDASGTVRKDLPLEQKAAHRFVHSLLRPVDQLDLIEFSDDVREVVAFTNRLNRIDSGIDNLRTGAATALYDAVYLSSQNLTRRQGRKVLVLISDGGNTVKGIDYVRALEQAVRSEVMVYSIIDVPIAASAGRDTGGEHALITLAEETGGRYYYAEGTDLDKTFAQVSDDLRTQYLLGYYPAHRAAPSDFRRIEVNLVRPGTHGYEVHHRTGYYASQP